MRSTVELTQFFRKHLVDQKGASAGENAAAAH